MAPEDLTPAPAADAAKVLHHRHFGPALPALNWVPAPRYLMRRDLVLRLLLPRGPGRILEFGCGSGALLAELAEQGFEAIGVEQSPAAMDLATRMTADRTGVRILAKSPEPVVPTQDYLAAFEVLEHIEDDHAALKDWVRHLRPGGTVLLSVPAHPERWNPADVWAGHFRRYRRSDLTALAAASGLIVEDLICYGFPVANLMERLAAPVYSRQSARQAKGGLDQAGRTGASGTDRRLLTRLWPVYSRFPVALALRGILALQRRFLGSDRGIGYILIARKA
jgi:SAM-dependent methyltransferase